MLTDPKVMPAAVDGDVDVHLRPAVVAPVQVEAGVDLAGVQSAAGGCSGKRKRSLSNPPPEAPCWYSRPPAGRARWRPGARWRGSGRSSSAGRPWSRRWGCGPGRAPAAGSGRCRSGRSRRNSGPMHRWSCGRSVRRSPPASRARRTGRPRRTGRTSGSRRCGRSCTCRGRCGSGRARGGPRARPERCGALGPASVGGPCVCGLSRRDRRMPLVRCLPGTWRVPPRRAGGGPRGCPSRRAPR